MNTNQIPTTPPAPPPSAPAPVAWIGFDWGHHEHAFALEEAASHQREEGPLTHSAESLHGWLRQLEQRFGGRPVAIGIEASRGAVIHALLQYPWLTIYPVNPVTSARYRKAFTPSGATDDLPDARVLLELVRDHTDKLRALQCQDPQTLKLAGLVEARRDMVDRRTQVLNQLNSLLGTYYPQVTELVSKLDSDLALDFLSRWPDLLSLKAAKPGTIKKFYYAHNLRRPKLMQTRLESIAKAVALTTDSARVDVAILQLRLLLDQLRAFRKHIAILDEAIKTLFADHAEAYLFRDLPGAGPALAPRLCVAFGTDRTLYPEPTSLQKLAGVAPVREKSGQQVWTHWRWLAPTFLRQTFVEWSAQTVEYSAWAGLFYKRMAAKGHGRHAILRALAFRWIRVLWKCWQQHTPYDEATYLKQLLRRKSPNALPA
jgi:transposase